MAARDEKTLRLILGVQLNAQHSWFRRKERTVAYVLMEVRQETDYVIHHIQKVAGFFAAMRAFSNERIQEGHAVFHIRLDDPENEQTLEGNIRKLIQKHAFTRFEYLIFSCSWLSDTRRSVQWPWIPS